MQVANEMSYTHCCSKGDRDKLFRDDTVIVCFKHGIGSVAYMYYSDIRENRFLSLAKIDRWGNLKSVRLRQIYG